MPVLKSTAAALVVALAAYAIYALAWRPLQCDIVKRHVQGTAAYLLDVSRVPASAAIARSGSAAVQRCLPYCMTDVDTYMTVAAEDRLLGRWDHAAQMYVEALQYDRRPELYLNLGEMQLRLNQRALARVNLEKACMFNLTYAMEIPDPDLRAAIFSEVMQVVNSKPAPRRWRVPAAGSR